MEPDKVIKLIRHHIGKPEWRRRIKFCKDFAKLIEYEELADYPDRYSAALALDGSTHERIKAQLAKSPIQEKLVARLKVDSAIFKARDESELRAMLEAGPQCPVPRDPSDCVITPQPLDAALHDVEEIVVFRLLKALKEAGGSRVVACGCPEPSGASFIAYAAAGRCATDTNGIADAAFLIRPYSGLTETFLPGLIDGQGGVRSEERGEEGEFAPERAFDRTIDELAVAFGVLPGTSKTAAQLLSKLEETRTLVFVLHADLISPKVDSLNRMHALLRAAKEAPGHAGYPVICLIGDVSDKQLRNYPVGTIFNFEGELRQAAGSGQGAGDRKAQVNTDFFRKEWFRFCQVREKSVSAADVDPRLRWGKWYYESGADEVVWPINIRIRAFFASNLDCPSYFDPTAGWTRLAEMKVAELPIDIRLALDEVVIQVRHFHEGDRNGELRALRRASTAIFWLTPGRRAGPRRKKSRTMP